MVAVILAAGSIIFWAAAGANRGWTKNKVPIRTMDEVTGIEGTTYKDQYIPGVDFLAEVLFGAGVLTGASFFFRTKPK